MKQRDHSSWGDNKEKQQQQTKAEVKERKHLLSPLGAMLYESLLYFTKLAWDR